MTLKGWRVVKPEHNQKSDKRNVFDLKNKCTFMASKLFIKGCIVFFILSISPSIYLLRFAQSVFADIS